MSAAYDLEAAAASGGAGCQRFGKSSSSSSRDPPVTESRRVAMARHVAQVRPTGPGCCAFLPVLFLIWVNTHGSWTIGLLVILVYWASGLKEIRVGSLETIAWTTAQRERILLIVFLCVAVLPITPYGTKLAFFPFQFVNSLPVNLTSINEWQPMPFNLFGAKLFLALIFGWFVAQLIYRSKWRLEELTLFFFGTAMACLHVRFLLVFVPFFAPLLATLLARWIPGYEREKDQYWINAGLMTATLAAMIHYFPSTTEIEKNIATMYPSGAVAFMRRAFHSRTCI